MLRLRDLRGLHLLRNVRLPIWYLQLRVLVHLRVCRERAQAIPRLLRLVLRRVFLWFGWTPELLLHRSIRFMQWLHKGQVPCDYLHDAGMLSLTYLTLAVAVAYASWWSP